MDQRSSNGQLALRWIVSLSFVYGSLWLLAEWLRSVAARSDAWGDFGAALVDSDKHDIGETIAIAVAIVVAVAGPRWGRSWFARCESAFARFANHRRQSILAAAIVPVVARLALLPAIPIPQPIIPDEFGHLLLADTFASGRITNPTHPMWRYFETVYVFHQPTYSSLYPAAQGFFMSVPLAVGLHPWFGICLSVGLMCAALCWMLQAWLPAKWALAGALAAGALSVTNYWMNSYWGGAPAAIGGALLLGVLPRLFERVHLGDACLAGLGAAVLSQSRPFEGLLLCLPVGRSW